MTTGFINTDSRVLVYTPTYPYSNYLCGKFESTSWSGDDSPDPKARTENKFHRSAYKFNDPFLEWRRTNQPTNFQYGNFNSVIGGYMFTSGLIDPWTANEEIALFNKLGEKTKSTDFNPAVFLAEGNQSLNTIANACTALGNSISHVKRGNMREAARALSVTYEAETRRVAAIKSVRGIRNVGISSRNEISSRWLELQYGWLPLVGDIQAAAETVANIVEKPHNLTFHVTKKRGTSTTDPYGIYLLMQTSAMRKKSWKVTISTMSEPFKLHLMDIAQVAWEKTPYSFVADWFLPIGSYMNAVKTRFVLPVTNVVVSDKMRTTRKITGYTFDTVNGGYVSLTGRELEAFCENFMFDRSILGNLPSVPLPRVVPLDEAFSWRRAANAISLAYQRFK